MTNTTLWKLAAIAMISSMAFTARVASASGLSCSDLSVSDPGCPQYIMSSEKMSEMGSSTSASLHCNDWSVYDPSCPAFLSATAAGGMESYGPTGGAEGSGGPQCTDLSVYDSRCTSFIP